MNAFLKTRSHLGWAVVAAAATAPAALADWGWTVNSQLSTQATSGSGTDSDTNSSALLPHSISCNSYSSFSGPFGGAGASGSSQSSLTGTQVSFSAYLNSNASASGNGGSANSLSHNQMTLTLTTTELLYVSMTYTGSQSFEGGAYYSFTGPTGTGASGSTSNYTIAAGSTVVFTLITHATAGSFAQGSTGANINASFSVTAVPAPGAAALLGLAGLARRRRR
jgi:MYXO-CTERM domain-containing protein